MKPISFNNMEEINLIGWDIFKDTPTEKVYHKNSLEKRLQIFENYTLEENLKNGKLYGLTIGRMNQPFLHYPDKKSKIYLIENYKNGKKIGTSQEFYDDGSRIKQEWENDQLNGKWETWYANGQKEKESNSVAGKLEGKQYEWYENGQLKLEEKFVSGIQTGESSKYLESGQLKRKKTYQKGKIEGIVYELWENNGKVFEGGVYSKTTFRNNTPHGKETVFYPNGKKMREGFYQNGKKQGERIWWNSNGSISIKEYYENGEIDGERFLYDEKGKLENIQKFSNGERIS